MLDFVRKVESSLTQLKLATALLNLFWLKVSVCTSLLRRRLFLELQDQAAKTLLLGVPVQRENGRTRTLLLFNLSVKANKSVEVRFYTL